MISSSFPRPSPNAARSPPVSVGEVGEGGEGIWSVWRGYRLRHEGSVVTQGSASYGNPEETPHVVTY